MKLTELEPTFLKIETKDRFKMLDDISQADGLQFLCPVCFKNNNGSVGTHSVLCWQPHVDQSYHPIPGRWKFIGTNYDDITLEAGSSSIFLKQAKCQAHFFITNGEIK